MIRLSVSVAFLSACLLSFSTVGQTSHCGPLQGLINERCCNKCPPGTYMVKFCSEYHQTICSPCTVGYYADKYNHFDRCEPCQTCQQGYIEKCTNITAGTCSCRSGFLCSNNICSVCEENKCSNWENLMKADVSSNGQLIEYSYHCEPKCPGNQYFDLKEDTCKPRTQCSALGHVEQFPGNKTHDSLCYKLETHRGNRNFTDIILCIGFVLVSITLFIYVTFTCTKYFRKHTTNKKPVQAVFTKTSDFHLSKEESGLHVFIKDEVKDTPSGSGTSLHSFIMTGCDQDDEL